MHTTRHLYVVALIVNATPTAPWLAASHTASTPKHPRRTASIRQKEMLSSSVSLAARTHPQGAGQQTDTRLAAKSTTPGPLPSDPQHASARERVSSEGLREMRL